ncbi:hypothetical protein SBV1_1130006 [Verrucomicrobia bacterium]|nr:hypothetical protein SBV1_1130006 [Verrucomicrobiota bacterium]
MHTLLNTTTWGRAFGAAPVSGVAGFSEIFVDWSAVAGSGVAGVRTGVPAGPSVSAVLVLSVMKYEAGE